MSLHIAVLTYEGGNEAFKRHVPLWESLHPAKCDTFCPVGDLVNMSWPVHPVGPSLPYGNPMLSRIQSLFDCLAVSQCDEFMVFEYDSFCTDPDFKRRKGLSCNLQMNLEPNRFSEKYYCNFPWYMDRETMIKLAKAMVNHPNVTEEGYVDRYISALARLAGVEVIPHNPPGFSLGTITPQDYRSLQIAIEHGASMFHGIKTKEVLDHLLAQFKKLDTASLTN